VGTAVLEILEIRGTLEVLDILPIVELLKVTGTTGVAEILPVLETLEVLEIIEALDTLVLEMPRELEPLAVPPRRYILRRLPAPQSAVELPAQGILHSASPF
jgi:hypothetical protein